MGKVGATGHSKPSPMSRDYDVIVFGASGYTGEWVVEECALLQKANSGFQKFSWAVAGRSERKLAETLTKVSEYTSEDLSNIPKIVANVNDEGSVRRMAAQGAVIINCVGPFRFYGEPVVKACVAEAANHVDISGECPFFDKMQMKYHEAAEANGVYIVSACGYESLPADCGVAFLEQKFRGDVKHIESYYTADLEKPPVLNFGSWQSLIYLLANFGELKEFRRRAHGCADPRTEPPKRFPIHYSNIVKGWCFRFPGVDEEFVKRSQHYFYTKENRTPVGFKVYGRVERIISCIEILILGLLIAVLSQLRMGRYLLETFPKEFSLGSFSREGTRREDADAVNWKIILVAKGIKENLAEPTDAHGSAADTELKLIVGGKSPPYRVTGILLLQAALSILRERHKLPSSGGVYTPGVAFANTTIIDRLDSRGIHFSVEQ